MSRFVNRLAIGALILLTSLVRAETPQPSPGVLFDFSSPQSLQPLLTRNGASISAESGSLLISADATNNNPVVALPIPNAKTDLSKFHYIEFDARNDSADKIVFTVWALSPNGWGGVSSYPASNTDGRESLDPGTSKHIRIDLYARYPGPDVYTTAANPANITTLEFQFALAKTAKPGKQLSVSNILTTGAAPTDPENKVAGRIVVPTPEQAAPAPGKRVYQQLPGWEKTSVTHVLGLPSDYSPDKKYPLIVEYTGNIFYHKFCYSTGKTDQGNMAWGLSKGQGYITLNLPFISEDGTQEQINAWGSPEKTAAYCIDAVRFVCDKYNADPQAVFITGFSRGQYACNYIALMNDDIADLWLGFIACAPGEAWDDKKGKGWNNVGVGWNDRAKRLSGRGTIALPAKLGAGVHVDVEFLEDRPSTLKTRQWMQDLLQSRPGTHAISGTVTDAAGKPLPNVRISSGPTHFTLTDAQGHYTLTSLIPGPRILKASRDGLAFTQPERPITLADKDLDHIDFAAR